MSVAIRLVGVCVALLSLLAALSPASPAHAAGIVYVAPGGSNANTCTSSATPCATVEGAIDQANDGDTIQIAAGTYTALTAADLTDVDVNNLTLQGAGEASTILDGNNLGSVVTVESGLTVMINDLTIQHGSGTTDGPFITGGGINALDPNGATLTLNRDSVSNNTLTTVTGQATGGGIYDGNGTLTLNASMVSNNTVSATGAGGIANDAALTANTATISNSTISHNTDSATTGRASDSGPRALGSLTVSNSTISYNTTTTSGTGGHADDAGVDGSPVMVSFSAISNNTVTATGANSQADEAGIDTNSGGATVTGSIISNNTVTATGAGSVANNAAIDASGSTLTITASTIANNSVTADAYAHDAAIRADTVTAINVTINGNSVTSNSGSANGAGITSATITAINTTISNNTVTGSAGRAFGGGINFEGAALANTILAGNTVTNGTITTSADCAQPVTTDNGGNIADDSSCTFAPGSLNGTNPGLGTLQDNGGPVVGAPGNTSPLLTQALLSTSPARDLGQNPACTNPPPTGAGDVDERGLPRHAVARGMCDSGAWDSGDDIANPGSIAGAIQFPGLPGHLGFYGSTDPNSPLGYITFQAGPNRLIVNKSDLTISCPDQCVGTPSLPLYNMTATLTLSGDISHGWGAYATGEDVVVTFTIKANPPSAPGGKATYTVTSVTVTVGGTVIVGPTAATAGPHANLFTGNSRAIFFTLNEPPVP